MKNILLLGKDFLEEEGFVSQCKALDIPFACTTKMQKTNKKQEEAVFEGTKTIIPWHRASILSANNLVVRSESALGSIDRAILYFDTACFYNQYAPIDKNRIQIITEDLVQSYQNITSILLERFKAKKQGGLIFLLKEMIPPFRDSKTATEILCPYIYTAQEAFIAFAEIIAHQFTHTLPDSVVLARTRIADDGEIATLLFKVLENVKLEKKLQKDAIRWVLLQNQSEGALRFLK